jgi:hypothetical protein
MFDDMRATVGNKRQQPTREADRRNGVRVHQRANLLRGGNVGGLVLGPRDPGVDEDKAEAAAGQTCCKRVDASRPVEIHLLDRNPAASSVRRAGKICRSCCIARRGRDLPAAAGKLACKPKAQTSRGADDDRGLVLGMVRSGRGHGALLDRLTLIWEASLAS